MAPFFNRFLLCTSIALNALSAGGIFTFPLLSFTLATQMKLAQPQLTTIVLAGMMSQYTISALVGSAVDNYGPAFCSFIAAILFSSGFGIFALECAHGASSGSFFRLTACFLLAGLGTVFAYFSSLFCASMAFPNHIGLASGSSMALFGLSPFLLCMIATRYFTDVATGSVDVYRFMIFLALLTSFVYLLGAVNLRHVTLPVNLHEIESASEAVATPVANENTPLISVDSRQCDPDILVNPSIKQLLRNTDFWLLTFYCVCILGASEMIISNIGSVLLSLPSLATKGDLVNSTTSSAHQVNLISISNTITRLVIGPIADFVSPVAAYLPCGSIKFPREHKISRFVFLTGSAIILDLVFAWMVFGVRYQSQLWVLSVGTGIAYGTVFTVLPSLISSLWGVRHAGRNFGFMMYAPFIGTPLFSYIYAFISSTHSRDDEICRGRSCWLPTFWFAISTTSCALGATAMLWRRSEGKI